MLICDAISGAVCVRLSSGGTSFYRPHSRNLRGAPPRAILDPPWDDFGTPWTDFGLPWDTLGPIVLSFWKILVADLLQISKIPEQPLSPTTPSKNKQRFKSSLPTIHPITSFLFICFVLQSRVNPKPKDFKK